LGKCRTAGHVRPAAAPAVPKQPALHRPATQGTKDLHVVLDGPPAKAQVVGLQRPHQDPEHDRQKKQPRSVERKHDPSSFTYSMHSARHSEKRSIGALRAAAGAACAQRPRGLAESAHSSGRDPPFAALPLLEWGLLQRGCEERLMVLVEDAVIHTSPRELERGLAIRYPVVLVFGDGQSAPCQALEPMLEELARAYAEQLRVVTVTDATLDEGTALRYGIERLPTVLFRRHGIEVARIVGRPDEDALTAHAEYLVGQRSRPPRVEGPSMPLMKKLAPAPAAGVTPNAEPGGAPRSANVAPLKHLILKLGQPVLERVGGCGSHPCL